MATNYSRQYIGLVVNGRRIVYVNGFMTDRTPGLLPLTVPVTDCLGGTVFFGAEFDVERNELLGLHFNSGLRR